MATATSTFEQNEADMRARGMHPVTLWIPDITDPEFIARYRGQIADLSAYSESEGAEFWDWVDKVQATDGWV